MGRTVPQELARKRAIRAGRTDCKLCAEIETYQDRFQCYADFKSVENSMDDLTSDAKRIRKLKHLLSGDCHYRKLPPPKASWSSDEEEAELHSSDTG